MAAPPHGQARSQAGDPEAMATALKAALQQVRAAKRAIRSQPAPQLVRMRAPFRSAAMVLILALIAVPASFALARLTAAHDKPATVIDVQYESARHEIIIWLADGPMTGLPRRVHRHYELIPHASMRVISYRTSADGQEVFVTLRASPSHRQDAAMVYKTRRR